MTGSKLFSAIADIFDEKRSKQKKREKELRLLLGKLKKYQSKLESGLDGESNKGKIKQLENELKVVEKKRKKVNKLLNSF